MAETKRKSRGEPNRGKAKGKRGHPGKKQKKGETKRPRLPNSIRKEIERLNPVDDDISSGEEGYDGRDLYEYEEELPEEESKKNRRFDPVENLEYELPDEFEDENVSSDDDNVTGGGGKDGVEGGGEEDDEGRQGITQGRSEFEGKKKRNINNVVISEAYPESEYNPIRDMPDGEGPISIADLLDPLHGKPGFSKLRKRMQHSVKKSVPTLVPLSKADQKRVEVKVTKEESKKLLDKWEPLIKKNREARTLFFDDDMDLGNSTVGAIASQFQPRTEFEKTMDALVHDDHVMDAHSKDGSRLLEMNMVSVEDEKDRHNRMAKMRSLLFRHEMKSKQIKNIKSKAYHRLLKKDRLKATSSQSQMDPEAAKDLAMKQEQERAKERMTLRHKGSSKWIQRKKQRGLDIQDEGTRSAIAEQQHLHAKLTRKINSMHDVSSSSDDSSDEEDTDVYSAGPDHARESKLLEKAKEKTLNVLNEDDEVPKSGVFSLPFMVRGSKKRNEAAGEEAKLALQEYETWSNMLEDSTGANNPKSGSVSGRMVFNASKKKAPESSNKSKPDDSIRSDNYYGNSDSEDDLEPKENADVSNDISSDLHKDVNLSHVFPHEDVENHHYSLFKSINEIAQVPGPKTTHDVSVFASGTWKKMKNCNDVAADAKQSAPPSNSVVANQNFQDPGKDFDEDSDADSEVQMVDGILSSDPKDVSYYELPSQDELLRQAFAGDDVENDFEKEKQEVLNEENPEPEKPALLPGWGQWTRVQKKKGLPSWVVQEHESLRRKREEALKKRRDASLKHVIISEKPDKKAAKLFTTTLPYPFTSREMYDQSIRVPLGPEFNPATTVGPLNRPEVMKKSGIIISPIAYEEVNLHENAEGHKHSARKQKKKKGGKNNSDRPVTKVKTWVKN